MRGSNTRIHNVDCNAASVPPPSSIDTRHQRVHRYDPSEKERVTGCEKSSLLLLLKCRLVLCVERGSLPTSVVAEPRRNTLRSLVV